MEEHARLNFSDFLSTLLETFFYVINEKFYPTLFLIYLVNKQAGRHFLPTLLVYSGLLVYWALQSKYRLRSSVFRNHAQVSPSTDLLASFCLLTNVVWGIGDVCPAILERR